MDEVCTLLVEHLQVFGLGVAFAVVNCYIAHRLGFFSAAHETTTNPSFKISGQDVIIAFFLFLGIELIMLPVFAIVLLSIKEGQWLSLNQLHLNPEMHGWVNLIGIVTSLITFLYFTCFVKAHKNLVFFGSRIKDNLNSFSIGALSWLVAYPIVTVIGQLAIIFMLLEFPGPVIEQVAVRQIKITMNYPALFYTTVLTIIFLVPVLEELLFRGFLQTWLRDKIGSGRAIALTSAIFALFHYSDSQGVDNVQLVVSLFVLACFLGYVYERQKNLWASIGLHSTFNAISIAMIIAQTSAETGVAA